MTETIDRFLAELTRSLSAGTFVKLTLGNYKGADEHLQKILVRLVSTKKGTRLFFLYRHETRDTAKNYDLDDGVRLIGEAIAGGFRSGHLFTTVHDFQPDVGKKGLARLNVAKPTFTSAPSQAHNRAKTLLIDPAAAYLRALGITDDRGRIRDREQDKWRQINKFVEILAGLVDKSELNGRDSLRMVDMGCGKGYLTFAAYDYFKNTRGLEVSVTRVDTKSDVVELCSGIAAACQFDSLSFSVGSIAGYEIGDIDVLIALHACNTATDDAIYKGIMARAALIVAAPCCHQEIRPQIKPPAMFRDILKHGVMLERTAETITDGLRSLLLERSGYSTKLFEFVSVEHTPKNNMLVGTLLKMALDPEPFDRQIAEIKAMYGIDHQHLETLLKG